MAELIRDAVKIACDHLVPRGIDRDLWKGLSPMERFYLKGLEVESHGGHRSGVFQELARGYGATDYTDLLNSDRANQTRLKTASEFSRKMIFGAGFSQTIIRQVLFAAFQVVKSEEIREGLNWLKSEVPDYWAAGGKSSISWITWRPLAEFRGWTIAKETPRPPPCWPAPHGMTMYKDFEAKGDCDANR